MDQEFFHSLMAQARSARAINQQEKPNLFQIICLIIFIILNTLFNILHTVTFK